MVNGRAKGASYERQVAKNLEAELGIKFSRILEQTREADLGDLQPEDPDFPFIIECKRYKQGSSHATPSHWTQACRAGEKAGKLPALVYKYDRLPERWRIPVEALARLRSYVPQQNEDQYSWKHAVELSFEDFCMIARELMCNAGPSD